MHAFDRLLVEDGLMVSLAKHTARALAAVWVGVICLGASSSPAPAKPAKHRTKKPRTVQEADWGKSPAARFAALGRAECLRELRTRKVAFTEVDAAPGVLAPVRLDGGRLNGVVFRTDAAPEARATSPHEVFDCRLVLALQGFADIVKANGFTEVRMFSAWRPPAKGFPADKLATRHPGALAIDVRSFVKPADGNARPVELPVLGTWKPSIGTAPCPANGTDRAGKSDEGGREGGGGGSATLHRIYCAAADERLFTVQLGPNYDRAHRNHFHLEVTPGVSWRLLL